MLAEVWYTKGTGTKIKSYSYEYTSDGKLYKYTDHANGKCTVYKYDTNNRLVSAIDYDESDMYHNYSYDVVYEADENRVDYDIHSINYMSGTTSNYMRVSSYYSYDNQDRLIETTIYSNSSGDISYSYDNYDRLTGITYDFSGFTNSIGYTYRNRTSNTTYTTAYIEKLTSTVGSTTTEYTYTYDNKGNITKIVYSTGVETRYVYDDLGQLIREDNGQLGETYLYTYDNAGNITSRNTYALTAANVTPTTPITTKTYGYSNGTWGDMLTSFNGTAITYDGIGNPLSYYNGVSYSFSWTGRRLTGLVKSGITYSFTYNDEGIRTSKTKNGVTTTYYLNGSQIVAEETSGNVTVYLYDAQGSPIGMQYHGASYADDSWDVFWYEKNLQGDIVAVYNESGTKLISYKYDAYGRWWSTQHNGGYSTQAYNNPFRYRGYYYDRDLELYYLNSRYYDSYTGRFISADGMMAGVSGDLQGFNLYVYCFNNPVNNTDNSGNWPSWATKLVAAVAVVAVVAVVAAITVTTAGAGTAAAVIAVGAAKGAAIGMVTGAAIGAGTAAVNHRVSTGGWEGAANAVLEGACDGALSGAITGAITGAAMGATKVTQAAKAWDSGTFKSGYQSMKYHYNKHVVEEGLTTGNNVLKYTQDAVSFANRNSSVLKYTYNYNYANASWNLTYSTGQGGMFTSAGKILTFWYR